MSNESRALATLYGRGAILKGHFVLTSGRHSDGYVNKDAVYPDTYEVSDLCRMMAARFLTTNVEVVVGPALGGIILSQWVAHHLREMGIRPVKSVYAEKDGVEGFVFKRGYDQIIHGRRVLVVEDILTTGGSVKKVVEAVRACGGDVIGVAALVNRGGVSCEQLDVKELVTLVQMEVTSWSKDDCPLCRDGVTVNTDVGKGAEFLVRKSTST